ncbi:MAG: aminoacyl-tRNA hydrolase [Solobacterium sp.]|nr:aminoacyl-tRNA hydrolase [Solobacterium sp.]
MKLIVGLGNPGKEYQNTRHNSGFMVMDKLEKDLSIQLNTEKWKARYTITFIHGEKVLLMKPLTYMNESGYAVSLAAQYYDIEPKDILVIHDDMDLPTGSLRIRKNGSAGGQKGMKSIIQALGTQDIPRIRIGVGHSEPKNHAIVPDWVLSPIPKSEREEFEHALEYAAQAAQAWVNDDIEQVMTKYNIRISHKGEKE